MDITVVSLNPSIDWQWSTPTFEYGGLNRANSGKRYASGKGINVCAALKNLGLDPLCIGFNYRENEDFITHALDEWGVGYDFVTVNGAVRVNIKLYDDATGEMTELNQPGAYVPAEDLHALYEKFETVTGWYTAINDVNMRSRKKREPSSNNSESPLLILSGSMPAGVPVDTYARLCAAWPGRVILDADGKALHNALTGKKPPFCIKPNLYELRSSFGVKLPTRDEIAEFCQMLIRDYGVEMICVSMGAEGAMLVTVSDAYYVPAQKVEVRGVQGAGDAMVAGIAYGLAQGLPVPELLRTAIAAATATVIRDGTLMCTLAGFRKYLSIAN